MHITYIKYLKNCDFYMNNMLESKLKKKYLLIQYRVSSGSLCYNSN